MPSRAPSTGVYYPDSMKTIWTYGGTGPMRYYVPATYDQSPASIPEPDRQERLTQYKQQAEKYPDNSVVFYNLGVAFSAVREYESAVKAFARAITFQPNWAVAHYNLANAYADLAKNSEAIDEYNKAIKLNPKYADARFNLALSFLTHGDAGLAKEQYKALKSLDAKEAPGAEALAAQLAKALKP